MKDLLALLDKYDINYKSFDTSIAEMDGSKVLRIAFKCNDKKDGSIQAFIEEFKEIKKPISITILK